MVKYTQTIRWHLPKNYLSLFDHFGKLAFKWLNSTLDSSVYFFHVAVPDLNCGQVYNLFHPHDPMSCRIEPLLDKSFRKIHSAPVPRHQSFPYNDDILYNYSALYENEPVNHETLSMKLSSASERKISSSSNARIAAYKEKMKYGE